MHFPRLLSYFGGISIAILSFSDTTAQDGDFSWWNENNNWDGVRHWSQYIPISPGRMGPNALPVPDMQKGKMDTTIYALAAGETHFAKNDFTANLFTRVNIPIKKTIAIQVWWVPIEYFHTDSVVRDSRAARTRSGEGSASGDIYFATLIPLVENHQKWPDLMLGINLKTASGGQLQNARYTDSPGYFFDLSAGKDFVSKDEKTKWRAYGTAGFYVYQTNRDDNKQNDAVLWGAGLDWNRTEWTLSLSANGYIGYLDDLDKPAVLRFETNYKVNSKFSALIRIQQGNNSYSFTSLRMGAVFNW